MSGRLVLIQPPCPTTHRSTLAFDGTDAVDKGRLAQRPLEDVGANRSTFRLERLNDFWCGSGAVGAKPADDPFGLFSVGLSLFTPARRASHE